MNPYFAFNSLLIGFFAERYWLYGMGFFDALIIIAIMLTASAVIASITEGQVSHFFAAFGTFSPLGLFLGFLFSNALESHKRWQAFFIVIVILGLGLVALFKGWGRNDVTSDDFEPEFIDEQPLCPRCGAINEPTEEICKFCETPLFAKPENEMLATHETSEALDKKDHAYDEVMTLVKLAELREKGLLTQEEFEKSKSRLLS